MVANFITHYLVWCATVTVFAAKKPHLQQLPRQLHSYVRRTYLLKSELDPCEPSRQRITRNKNNLSSIKVLPIGVLQECNGITVQRPVVV